MAFPKKRSNGKYELVEKVGGKNRSIAQMGEHATLEAALAFQRKEARAQRRKGETLIGAETRRFKARKLIEVFEIHMLRNMPAPAPLTQSTLLRQIISRTRRYADHKIAGVAESKRRAESERTALIEAWKKQVFTQLDRWSGKQVDTRAARQKAQDFEYMVDKMFHLIATLDKCNSLMDQVQAICDAGEIARYIKAEAPDKLRDALKLMPTPNL